MVIISQAIMKKDKNPKPFPIHPKAQVIITGRLLKPEHVQTLKERVGSNFCVTNWFTNDGIVGHIDSIQPGVEFEKFYWDFERLASLSFLDIGVTVMSGPPGVHVTPVASYMLKNGTFSKRENVHFGHPPPRRLKP